MKPVYAINDFRSLQEQPFSDQDLIKFLNVVNNTQCFI